MSAPKFTPGPWHKGTNDDSVVSAGQSEEQRGSANFEYYGGHLIAESIEKHNIPLIAAAPDLLEALKNIHEWLGNLTDWEGAGDPDLDGIRAAIAKAEGGAS